MPEPDGLEPDPTEPNDAPPHRPPPYAFSTGPTSPTGKSIASQNAMKHGCCSKTLILPDEDEQEWHDLKQGWMDDYEPHTHPARALVYDAAVAQWLLLRARRRYYEAEWSVHSDQPDAMQWTDQQHQKIERFTRYRTTAERSFTRALNNLERLRKNRLQEADRIYRREQQAAQIEARRQKDYESRRICEAKEAAKSEKVPDPPKSRGGELFQGQNHPKKQRKIVTLEQWAQVFVEDGKTVTKLFPSNEKLIEHGKTMDPPPELVYRRLEFDGEIPPEYHWTASADSGLWDTGGAGIQRMTVDTWLDVIDREKAGGTGHIGPTGVGNLPRPKERGGCDCEVCAHNRDILERRENESRTLLSSQQLTEPRP